jgi:hypothetical protein
MTASNDYFITLTFFTRRDGLVAAYASRAPMPRNLSNPNVAYQMTPPAPASGGNGFQYPSVPPPLQQQQQPLPAMHAPLHASYPAAPPMQQPHGTAAPAAEFMSVANQYMGVNMTPFAQPMMAMGQQMLDQQLSRLSAGSSYLSGLRYYFNVTNSYVLQKLKIVLCPFTNKVWKRIDVSGAGGIDLGAQGSAAAAALQAQQGAAPLSGAAQPVPPRNDVNAPDLYIPVMAFVTYVLLIALAMVCARECECECVGFGMASGIDLALSCVCTAGRARQIHARRHGGDWLVGRHVLVL